MIKGKHKRTLEKLFEHPVSHNIDWKQVENLFDALGANVSETSKNHVRVVLAGQEAMFHKPHHKQIDRTDEVVAIRRFLESAGVNPRTAGLDTSPSRTRVIAVVSDREARVYELEGREADSFRLVDSDRVQRQGSGDSDGFYESVSAALSSADEILLVGVGEDQKHSSARPLFEHLAHQEPDLAVRVVAVEAIVDTRDVEPRILAHAQAVFAGD